MLGTPAPRCCQAGRFGRGISAWTLHVVAGCALALSCSSRATNPANDAAAAAGVGGSTGTTGTASGGTGGIPTGGSAGDSGATGGAGGANGASGAGGGSPVGIQCQPGLTPCGDACVDLTASTDHCGTCDTTCPEGRLCNDGVCSSECAPGYTQCGTTCVNVLSNTAHCGVCDHECALGTPCSGGDCGCPDGTILCDSLCTETTTDVEHCGACDTPCQAGAACVDGACACPDGTEPCNDACASLNTAQNCGSCGNACQPGQICGGTACIADSEACPAPSILCDSACVDAQTDRNHCGTCDKACPGAQTCQGGACVCPPGRSACGDSCVDTTTSALNCGTCGNACKVGQTCSAGTCTCSDSSLASCPSGCRDLDSDPDNCGACSTVCQGGYPCTNGECACPEGTELCDGECVNTDSDAAHCGTCTNTCPDEETCIVGQCSGSIGDECTNQLAYDITLSQIAAYQAGKVVIMDDGSAVDGGSRPVDVVAAKAALVRAFVTLGQSFTSRVLSARLTLLTGSGAEPIQYFSKREVSTASTEDNLATTFNIEVPPEDITADTRYVVEIVECDATTAGSMAAPRFPASGDAPLDARVTGRLTLQFIPIIANGRTPDTSAARLDELKAYMEAMYPIEGMDYTVGTPMNAPTTVSATGDGWSETLDALRSRHGQDGAPNTLYYYGLLEPAATLREYCGGSCVAGIGYVPSASNNARDQRVAQGLSYGGTTSAETMAHEVGHNHGRQHAPCGGASGVDPNYPYANAQIGWWGLRYPDTLFAPTNTTDIMGYCNSKWVSDYTYKGILERVATINGNAFELPSSVVGLWRIVLTGPFGPSWGIPITTPAPPAGEPEGAVILDRDGDAITEVTVYRTLIDHLGASSVMVPEPEPGWHAIEIAGELPLAFGSADSSVP